MQKRTKQQRLEQQRKDTALATIMRGVKASDGALKIYNNRLEAMPERKLTYQSKEFDTRNKHYNSFSNA